MLILAWFAMPLFNHSYLRARFASRRARVGALLFLLAGGVRKRMENSGVLP
jgi:hypothetical protein